MKPSNTIACWIVALILVGCGGVSAIESGERIADAGVAYADSIPAVYDESFELAVIADSLNLMQIRASFSEEQRAEALAANDDLLIERLAILRALKGHAGLLRTYFIALKALTKSDAATGISTSTEALVNRMGTLGLDIAEAEIAGKKISSLIEPAVSIAVAAYQNAALQSELEARADAIERELALQKASLAIIRDQMIADRDLQIQIEERNPLFFAYIDQKPLPSDWSARRISAFERTINIQSLNAASKAAASLHQGWMAFSENRLGEEGVFFLIRDVEELVALAARFKS